MYNNDLHLTSDAQFAVKTPRCVGCTMYNALCCAVLCCTALYTATCCAVRREQISSRARKPRRGLEDCSEG